MDKKIFAWISIEQGGLLLALTLVFSALWVGGVNPASAVTGTATTITCQSGSLVIGGSTTCTVTVTPSSADNLPITFQYGGSGGLSAGGCTTSAGTCTTQVTATGVGSPTIIANYPGDSSYGSSSAQAGITVTIANSQTTISCNPSTVPLGSLTMCTATVVGFGTPGGTVTFSQQTGTATTSLSNGPIPCTLNSGSCKIQITAIAAGSATIAAQYTGDSNDAPSPSNNFFLTITLAVSTTTVICNPATVALGGSTSCTASVSGAFGAPTGTIEWSTSGMGTFSANVCTLGGGGCASTYTPQTSSTITGSYPGDSNYMASSGTFQVTLTGGSTSTSSTVTSTVTTTQTTTQTVVSPTTTTVTSTQSASTSTTTVTATTTLSASTVTQTQTVAVQPKTHSILVETVAPGGTPLPDNTITVVNATRQNTEMSNSSGEAVFADLVTGQYTVSSTINGTLLTTPVNLVGDAIVVLEPPVLITTPHAVGPSGQALKLVLSGNITATQLSDVRLTRNSSTSYSLLFTLSGKSGTYGTATITVKKSDVPTGLTPRVYVEGTPSLHQSYTQDASNYYVTFSTQLSSDQVQIQFTSSSPPPPQYNLLIAVLAVSALVLVSGLVIWRRRVAADFKKGQGKR